MLFVVVVFWEPICWSCRLVIAAKECMSMVIPAARQYSSIFSNVREKDQVRWLKQSSKNHDHDQQSTTNRNYLP
jgi:hypothetical protein